VARTFYRIVQSDPPTRRDFESHEALGRVLIDPDQEQRRMWQGISVFTTEAQARNKAHDYPGLGGFIAAMRVRDEEAIRFARTGRNRGHHTLWGEPEALLGCVVAVVPV